LALFPEENANKAAYISPYLHNAFYQRLLLSPTIVTISELGEVGLSVKLHKPIHEPQSKGQKPAWITLWESRSPGWKSL